MTHTGQGQDRSKEDLLLLRKGLKIWRETALKTAISSDDHLTPKQLEAMKEHGGITGADDAWVEHLSLCPLCLDRFSALLAEKNEPPPLPDASAADDYIMAIGELQAADEEKRTALPEISTACRRFTLGIYPDRDNPDNGMLTVEVGRDLHDAVEGKKVTVRDKEGRVLLSATFHDGKVARLCKGLREADLNAWTILVAGNNA